MTDDEREAEITRITNEMLDQHAQEADRKSAEIMEKLDIQALNSGINKAVNPTSLEAAQSMTYKAADRYKIGKAPPDYSITFQNAIDGKQVQIGKIDFNGGALKFEGNFEESALKFMDHLARSFQGRLKAEHLSAAKLVAEFVTFELSDVVELDDTYRKGFNDAIYAVRGILSKKIKEMENKP